MLSRHITVGENSGLAESWIRNDDSPEATAHNIGLLALKEAEIVMKRLRDTEGLRYDIGSQALYDGKYRIPDEEASSYFWGRIKELDKDFSQRIGPATLRRALAVIAAEGAGEAHRVRLVGEAAEAPRSLHGIFYAKDEGGESASDSRGGPAEGSEPAGVPGEAGRGRSGEGLKAGPERTAQVRVWADEIRAGWRSKLDIVVHDSAEAIGDARLREAVLKEGGGVRAFFDQKDGLIHLLADRVGNKADAEILIRHEGMHRVFDGELKQEYNSILEGVRRRIPKDRLAELQRDYRDADGRVLVEEYLAYLGENNPKATAWQKFTYEVKQVLQRYFGRSFEVTDADVLAFLTKANRRLERSGGGGDVNELSSPQETPAYDGQGRLRFSKSTTAELKKLIRRFQDELKDHNLDEEQKGISVVVFGKRNLAKIEKAKRSDLEILSGLITLEGGHSKYGAKHIVVDHFSGKRGHVTALEVVKMGEVIRRGQVSEREGKRIYEWFDENKVRFRVVISKNEEKVITFYSNRKRPAGSHNAHHLGAGQR
jgi:hypothetical protein